MKRVLVFTLLIGIFLTIAGCSKKEEPVLCVDFLTFPFKQTYLRYFQDEEIYFIKGVALDVNKHGREIKIIEDLKGNFADKSSIFVWGTTGNQCGNPDARMDYITQYNKNDTLIMFIEKASKRFNFNGGIERHSDYTVLGGYSSVVKLSNGYVTGYINNWGVDILWDELQEELQMRLNSYEKPEELIPDPFYIAYKGIEKNNWIYPTLPNENNNFYFIKGLILDHYLNDGIEIEIEIINDLKGNFPKEIKTAIVWGTHRSQFISGRLDDFKLYNRQDTLLMLLRQVSIIEEIGSNGIEKREHYSTQVYTFSVLKLLNNTVSGHITSTYRGEENMSWDELQTLLYDTP